MRKILISIFFVSLLISGLAHAEGKGKIYGLGTVTCGKVLTVVDDPRDEQYLRTYIGGYITAANQIFQFKSQKKISLSLDVLYHLALKKCRDYPKYFFSNALLGVLIDEQMSLEK